MRGALDCEKGKVPVDGAGGVDQRGGENRAGLAPGPAVEKAGDGSQDHVAPVGKAQVGDVRKAKTIEAIHQPVRSLLEARASMFWSRPRKRNSSGQAVKNKMPSDTSGSDFHCDHCGSNSMK